MEVFWNCSFKFLEDNIHPNQNLEYKPKASDRFCKNGG